MLLAKRTTTNQTISVSPLRFVMGQGAVLPIRLEIPTWQTLPWKQVRITEDLIAIRIRQIERRDRDMEEAKLRLRRMREQNKECWDDHYTICQNPLMIDDVVLLHNAKL